MSSHIANAPYNLNTTEQNNQSFLPESVRKVHGKNSKNFETLKKIETTNRIVIAAVELFAFIGSLVGAPIVFTFAAKAVIAMFPLDGVFLTFIGLPAICVPGIAIFSAISLIALPIILEDCIVRKLTKQGSFLDAKGSMKFSFDQLQQNLKPLSEIGVPLEALEIIPRYQNEYSNKKANINRLANQNKIYSKDFQNKEKEINYTKNLKIQNLHKQLKDKKITSDEFINKRDLINAQASQEIKNANDLLIILPKREYNEALKDLADFDKSSTNKFFEAYNASNKNKYQVYVKEILQKNSLATIGLDYMDFQTFEAEEKKKYIRIGFFEDLEERFRKLCN